MLLQLFISKTTVRPKRKLNELPGPDPFTSKHNKIEEQRD